jgi:hypothetical protein
MRYLRRDLWLQLIRQRTIRKAGKQEEEDQYFHFGPTRLRAAVAAVSSPVEPDFLLSGLEVKIR